MKIIFAILAWTCGIFQVSETTYVRFSSGNLQYQPSTQQYRFAENQYTAIGSANTGFLQHPDEWFDLLEYADFTQPDQGRVLSKTEWEYLFETRTDGDNKWGFAVVNEMKGIILLPDNLKNYTAYLNTDHIGYNDNEFNATEWNGLESKGVVFLPVTGTRQASIVTAAADKAWYWSSTEENDQNYCFFITDGSKGTVLKENTQLYGNAVRLVQETDPSTAIDNTPFSSGKGRGEASKILRDGQLLILHGDKIYNSQGQMLQ